MICFVKIRYDDDDDDDEDEDDDKWCMLVTHYTWAMTDWSLTIGNLHLLVDVIHTNIWL